MMTHIPTKVTLWKWYDFGQKQMLSLLSTLLSPHATQYTSKTIQNELMEVIGDSIRNDIITEVKQAKFYSVIADEVSDTANREELSLSLHFVFNGRVKEVFVDFVEVERITGQVLAQAILQWLSTHGLSRANIRSQCYDGASNMSGAVSGCKSIVQQEAPLALYVHCAAHRLNLAVVSAFNIQSFKNAESYVGEIARFSITQQNNKEPWIKPSNFLPLNRKPGS